MYREESSGIMEVNEAHYSLLEWAVLSSTLIQSVNLKHIGLFKFAGSHFHCAIKHFSQQTRPASSCDRVSKNALNVSRTVANINKT